jgi:hypothetical protein
VRKNFEAQVENLLNQNLQVRAKARGYLAETSWSPVRAALLLSGIQPSGRWDVAVPKRRKNKASISYADLFAKLRRSVTAPERGLDGEMVLPESLRFENALNILLLWDQVFGSLNDCPTSLAPKDYVVWLLDMSRKSHVILPESRWLASFANLFDVAEPYAQTVIPREVLVQLEAKTGKKRSLMPKHKLGRFVEEAWVQATSKGEASTDPDPILASLAKRIESNGIPGVRLEEGYSYSHKADLLYVHDKKSHSLRRESLARQLRRVSGNLRQARGSERPTDQSTHGLPFIERVPINENVINKFTDPSKMTGIACNLLVEVVQYLRLACLCRDGWDLGRAIVVGEIVRLTKLLMSLYPVAFSQLPGMIALIASMAIETIVDIKYLIKEFDADLIDKYVRYSMQEVFASPGDWGDLSPLHRAMAVGLEDEFLVVLKETPRFLHGSLGDSFKFHLHKLENGRHEPILAGITSAPQTLLSIGTLALSIVQEFIPFNDDHPYIDELKASAEDLFARLKKAETLFSATQQNAN